MNRYLIDSSTHITVGHPATLNFIRIAIENAVMDFKGGRMEGFFQWLVEREIDHHFSVEAIHLRAQGSALQVILCHLNVNRPEDAVAIRLRYDIQPSPIDVDPDREQMMGIQHRQLF